MRCGGRGSDDGEGVTARVPLAVLCLAGLCGGCGLPRHLAARPDHDLPAGFSSTYRRALVLEGAVPPAPSDAALMERFAGPEAFPAAPPAPPRP